MEKATKIYEKRDGDRIVVTLNSVYVLRDGICVAVRSRSSGIEEWDVSHKAIGMVLQGGLVYPWREGLGVHAEVQTGDRLCLASGSGKTTLLTSEVVITAIVAKPSRHGSSIIDI